MTEACGPKERGSLCTTLPLCIVLMTGALWSLGAGSAAASAMIFCGDGQCNGGETACSCALDCADVCGDGCCTGAEMSCGSSPCATDCGPCRTFLCYDVKAAKGAPKFSPVPNVHIEDAFEDLTFTVSESREICNPTSRDASIPTSPTHLNRYQLTVPKRTPRNTPTGIVVMDEFGTLSLDLLVGDKLLVPTAKSLVGPPQPLAQIDTDHFKCYDVKVTKKTPKFPSGIQLTLGDQFEQGFWNVFRPAHLCPVARKNQEPVLDPCGALLCYDVRPAKGSPKFKKIKDIFTNDQFGALKRDAIDKDEVCVPATIKQGQATLCLETSTTTTTSTSSSTTTSSTTSTSTSSSTSTTLLLCENSMFPICNGSCPSGLVCRPLMPPINCEEEEDGCTVPAGCACFSITTSTTATSSTTSTSSTTETTTSTSSSTSETTTSTSSSTSTTLQPCEFAAGPMCNGSCPGGQVCLPLLVMCDPFEEECPDIPLSCVCAQIVATTSTSSTTSTSTSSTTTTTEAMADLSLTKSVSPSQIGTEQTVTFTVTLHNAGPATATGVEVTDVPPTSNFAYSSSSADTGTYDHDSGLWSVGTLASGADAILRIIGNVIDCHSTPPPLTNTAEVTDADQTDPDSPHGNNVPSEDDQAAASVGWTCD